MFKYLKSTPVSSTQLKMSINIFERYLHTESSLVRFFWTSLRLCHKRVRLTMPSKRHSWEADVTDCYQLSVDMLLLVVVGMMSLDNTWRGNTRGRRHHILLCLGTIDHIRVCRSWFKKEINERWFMLKYLMGFFSFLFLQWYFMFHFSDTSWCKHMEKFVVSYCVLFIVRFEPNKLIQNVETITVNSLSTFLHSHSLFIFNKLSDCSLTIREM